MDIETLKSLGLDIETLGDRIVDQAVDALLNSTGFNPETETETRYISKFQREIDARIKDAVDAKISALAELHIVPRVGELIEKANMTRTNTFGEKTSPPMTFKEYLAYRADEYMTEDVDRDGDSKRDLESRGASTYNWKKRGPRLTILMSLHIKDELERATKAAVTDVNKALAESLQKAATDAIKATADNLKVDITA